MKMYKEHGNCDMWFDVVMKIRLLAYSIYRFAIVCRVFGKRSTITIRDVNKSATCYSYPVRKVPLPSSIPLSLFFRSLALQRNSARASGF